MVPYEDRVSGVDLTDDELQVAQGSTITDGDGTRQATLLLEPGTDATATLPDGSDEGPRRQAQHPRHRVHDRRQRPGRDARRAAADLGLHVRGRVLRRRGRQGRRPSTSSSTSRSSPTSTTSLGFPAGTAVPMGYYDREKAQWIAAKNGDRHQDRRRVRRPRAARRDRRRRRRHGARSPRSASTTPSWPSSPSSTTPARASGAPRSRTSRRGTTTGPTACPTAPAAPARAAPTAATRPATTRAAPGGSIILCENQVLGEQPPIAGTPYTLAYQSDRVPGRRTGDTLEIPLTGADAARVAEARRPHDRGRGPHDQAAFDARAEPRATRSSSTAGTPTGAAVQGRQKVDVTIDYVYPAVYRTPGAFRSSFAAIGGAILSANRTRTEISVGQQWSGIVGGPAARPPSALAGWSVDVHHTYDPVGRTLYLGDGTKRSAEGQNFDVIATTKTGLAAPEGMATTADGALLVADSARARRAPDRAGRDDDGRSPARGDAPASAATAAPRPRRSSTTRPTSRSAPTARSSSPTRATTAIRRIAPTAGSRRSPAPATAATAATAAPRCGAQLDEPSDVAVDAGGAVYVVDRANHAVRRIGPDGDHHHARRQRRARASRRRRRGHRGAKLRSPRDVAVARPTAACFVADSGNHRVRRIDPDGTIDDRRRRRPATATAATAGSATAAQPRHAVGGPAAARRRPADRRRRQRARCARSPPTGTIATVAGNGTPGSRGDGGPAAQARIDFPQAIALGADDTIYLADDEQRPRARARAEPARACSSASSRSPSERRPLAVRLRPQRPPPAHGRRADQGATVLTLRLRRARAADVDHRRRRPARRRSSATRTGDADRDRRPLRPDDDAAGHAAAT